MGTTNKVGALIVIALAATGCSNGSLTSNLFQTQNDTAIARCDCFFMDDGYTSAQECRDDETFTVPAQVATCADRALAADSSGLVRAALRCTIDAGNARLDCYATANCDEMAFDDCDVAYALEVGMCPQPTADAQAAVQAAAQQCLGVPGGGGPMINGCPEGSIGSATGDRVATGNTTNGDNDIEGTCGGSRSNDAVLTWMAPMSGTVTISTTGSDYDTLLYVREGVSCSGGTELDCDDDGGVSVDSSITISVTSGQQLLIVVEGFGDDTGNYVVNINYQ